MPVIRSNVVDVYAFRRPNSGPAARRDPLEFLVLRRAEESYMGGTWQAVHGKIEAGETAVQAALRELREETGLRPAQFWQLDFVNTFYVARFDCIQMCPCFAAEIDAAAEVVLSDEHSAFEWLAVEPLLSRLMWPGQRHAVREVLAEIITPTIAGPHLRIDVPPANG